MLYLLILLLAFTTNVWARPSHNVIVPEAEVIGMRTDVRIIPDKGFNIEETTTVVQRKIPTELYQKRVEDLTSKKAAIEADLRKIQDDSRLIQAVDGEVAVDNVIP